MDGVPALNLWDLVSEMLHVNVRRNSSHEACETTKHRTKQKRLKSEEHAMEKLDVVPPNTKQPHYTALLFIFEGDDAVIDLGRHFVLGTQNLRPCLCVFSDAMPFGMVFYVASTHVLFQCVFGR